MNHVTVIGAGLAGSECAWQLAQRGVAVTLREMKPEKKTPAHVTDYFAELCCSNSLRGAGLENAVGLLKEELRRLNSLIMRCADATAVPAGGALAVDREGFARMVNESVLGHPNITMVPGEVTAIPEGNVVIASGPLTSDALADAIAEKLGGGTTLAEYLDGVRQGLELLSPYVTVEAAAVPAGEEGQAHGAEAQQGQLFAVKVGIDHRESPPRSGYRCFYYSTGIPAPARRIFRFIAAPARRRSGGRYRGDRERRPAGPEVPPPPPGPAASPADGCTGSQPDCDVRGQRE